MSTDAKLQPRETRFTRRRVIPAIIALATAIALLTITSAGQGIAEPGAPNSSVQDPGCPARELIVVPGTNETHADANPDQPVGMLKPVSDLVQKAFGSQLRVFVTPYPALAYTNGTTYKDSKDAGINAVRAELDRLAQSCTQTKVALIGYSQGADIAGDIACEVGAGKGFPAANVVGVGLLADPGNGTKGSTEVGPKTGAEGIMGARNCDFGSLSDRVSTICAGGDQPDLYCATDKKRNPILSGIADVVGKTSTNADSRTSEPSGNGTSETTTPAAPSTTDSTTSSGSPNGLDTEGTAPDEVSSDDLVSDFSSADVAGLPTKLTELSERARSGDANGVAQSASTIADSIEPLLDIVDAAAQNPGIEQALNSAPPDSPEGITAKFFALIKTADLGKAKDEATQLAQSALAQNGGGARAPTDNNSTTAPQTLADGATKLNEQVGSIASTPVEELATATDVLSTIKPKVFVDQMLNIGTGSISFASNLPKIVEAIGRIPGIIGNPGTDLWGKVDAIRALSEELNVLFEPLVKLAAGIDFRLAAKFIGMIPDPSGLTQTASLLLDYAGNLDIIRIANRIGDIQNTAWNFIESCKTGCNLMIGTDLIGPLLDFATIAVQTLTGGGQKTSTDQLGQADDVSKSSGQTSTQLQSGNLDEISKTLQNLAASEGADSLGKLVDEGLDAYSFMASGSHVSYDKLVVDKNGRTALQWLGDWLVAQFNKAGV